MENCFNSDVFFDEPLKDHVTFKVGGNADVFIAPHNEGFFIFTLRLLIDEEAPFFVIGGGSNIVPKDDGFRGVVLSTKHLNSIELLDENSLRCGAGATFDEILDFCVENELTGLEEFAGLPGTVGGAVYMNARCYDVSASDVLKSVCFYQDGKVIEKIVIPEEWDYKKSPYQCADIFSPVRPIVLSAVFSVEKGHSDEIEDLCNEKRFDREKKGHFKFPSAGSVFKNNRDFGEPSGRIIDMCGLRGKSIGGAQVAPFHGNFIINLGHATANDIKTMVDYVKQEVLEKTGKSLECEIIFL